jgi:hypothetical protein
VSAENVIDVSGQAFSPAECDAPSSAAPSRNSFALIAGSSEIYLLLPGTVIECEEAAVKLRSAGVAVLRTGRYLGDPIGELQAEWFVRFVHPNSVENLPSFVGKIIERRQYQHSRQEPADLRIRVLTYELTQIRTREAALRAEILKLKENQSVIPTPTESTIVVEVEKNLVELKSEPPAAGDTEHPLQVSAPDVMQLEPSNLSPAPGRIRAEIEIVLETLLPRIRLIRNSIDVVTAEFANRRAAYRALRELEETPSLPSSWKKIHGVQGWWERHVSNGQDDQGRVYAHLQATDRRWDVLISHKGEQARDLNWLRRLG